MKLKKLIISSVILIVTLLIYLTTIDNKIYYVALGDSVAAGQNPYGKIGYGYSDYVMNYLDKNDLLAFYTKDFTKSGQRAVDLKRLIDDNQSLQANDTTLTIKNALVKADLVTLSIGANDLFYKIGLNDMSFNLEKKEDIYRYIDEVMEDIDELLGLIRKYCKEDIIMVGYYNPIAKLKDTYIKELEPIFLYGNTQMRHKALKHNAYFIDIYTLFLDNPSYLPNPLDIHPSMAGYEAIATKIIDIIEKDILN